MNIRKRVLQAINPSAKKFFFRSALVPPLFIFCLIFAAAAQAAAIGQVTTLLPGVSVSRAGTTLPLAAQSSILVSDIISTDATGRARIVFNDDSIIDIGSNTSLNMREFAEGPRVEARFKAHLVQGLARVITGRIVELNPAGFTVTTPEGTVGIRGTIISVRSRNGLTTVYVENTTRRVYVNGVNVPGGEKITIPGDPERPQPIQPQDRRELGRDLAFRGGAGTAAAAPEPMGGAGQPTEILTAGTTRSPGAGLLPPETPLTDIALLSQNLGDSLLAGGAASGGGSSGTMASVAGGLITSASATGNFGFNVDLFSGAISAAYLSVSGPVNAGYGPGLLNVNMSGGTGLANASGFSANTGFTGSATFNAIPITPQIDIFSSAVNLGTFNAAPSGSSSLGGTIDYSIYFGSTAWDAGTNNPLTTTITK